VLRARPGRRGSVACAALSRAVPKKPPNQFVKPMIAGVGVSQKNALSTSLPSAAANGDWSRWQAVL